MAPCLLLVCFPAFHKNCFKIIKVNAVRGYRALYFRKLSKIFLTYVRRILSKIELKRQHCKETDQGLKSINSSPRQRLNQNISKFLIVKYLK